LVDHAGILEFQRFRLSSVCHIKRNFSQRCDADHKERGHPCPHERASATSFCELSLLQNFAGKDARAPTVFDIGGNKVRLMAAIHYNRRKIYVRAVLTHREYDDEIWKE
jgi:hypothetical protein